MELNNFRDLIEERFSADEIVEIERINYSQPLLNKMTIMHIF